jgi:Flp pilus assembly protein TadD
MSDAVQHYLAGLKLYGESRHAEAIAEYALALEARNDWVDCLQALGMAQMNSGQLDRALEVLTRVTELAPEDPLAFTSLSMCLQRKDRIEDAERHRRRRASCPGSRSSRRTRMRLRRPAG